MSKASEDIRRLSDERGFANEGCVISLCIGLLGLLVVMVMVLLGRPIGWNIVLALVVIGVPGFVFSRGLTGLFWLGGLALGASLLAGRQGETIPAPLLYVYGGLVLIGTVGFVINILDRLKGPKKRDE